NASFGGAGISSDGPTPQSLQIVTTGNMSMYGGTSNAAHPYGAAVYIHSEAGGPITLDVGGNLHVQAGIGSSAPAIIGSVDGPGIVDIKAAGNINVVAAGSYAGIGSSSAGYGATVNISSGGSINLTASATRSVKIGSHSDLTGPTDVTLSAGKSIIVTGSTGGVGLGVEDMTGASSSNVTLKAGWDANSSMPSSYGGDITLTGTVVIQTNTMVNIVANESSAGAYGSVSLGAGTTAYGNSIAIVAGGNNDVFGSLISTGAIYLDAGWSQYGDSTSLRGGDLNLKAGSNLQAGGYVEMYAQAGTASPYGGGNITQAGSLASVGDISMYADRNITINGSVTSSDGYIYGRAGYSETRQFGGNIEVSGTLTGEYGVELIAETGTSAPYGGGNITQYGSGSISVGYGEVRIIGGGNVMLNGSINGIGGEGSGYTAVTVKAGYSDYDEAITPNGGNISVAGTIYGYGYVGLYAETGASAPYGGGSITQSGSSSITANDGDLTIVGGGNVTLDGSVSAYGGGWGVTMVSAGVSNATGYVATPDGGNISVSGNVFGQYGVEMYAVAGSSAGANGSISQTSGAISTGGYDSIGIYADGNVNLHGRVETPGSLFVSAGLANATDGGNSIFTSMYGGNITLGAGSRIIGSHVELTANGGYYGGRGLAGSSAGNIAQAPGGLLQITGISSLYGSAEGNVELLGSTLVYGGAPVDIQAGTDNLISQKQVFQDKHITINSLNASGSDVSLFATGQIFANTQDVGSVEASISNSNSGGIVINNTGMQPYDVDLMDGSLAPSVSFFNSGDLTLDGNTSFETLNPGSIFVASGGNLTHYGANIDTNGGSLILGAGGVLSIREFLGTDGSLGIAAPVVYVDGGEGGGGIQATGDIFLAAAQQMTIGDFDFTGIYSDANITVNAGTLLMQTGGLFAQGGVDITAGSILGVRDSFISAGTDITAKVAGDIRWNDFSHMMGYNDVFLTLSGGSSTVYLNDTAGFQPSSIASGQPTTVHLTFLGRSSGGVVIDGVETTTTVDGSSGFYANGLPATTGSGGGLVITYANTTAIVLDPCASSPDLCKPPSPKDNPVIDVVEADPCATAPDSAQCKALKDDENDKTEKGDFGDEDDGKQNEKSSQKKVAQCGV
ncbi:MAG: hypothetical protein Q7T59_00075, partial [Candidatus Woesebacteria bacterium]|nr:hypothetical protein [Candidatus Woesebacteria bacterium]